ncbi:MAG TPA: imidazole glycerol phosphate synthase cyclase subunit [Bacteroidota bacterium]|nr:imidazole glycerol phosphate synthase cyclase subunit [Bacteroidota bacterium]
MKTIRIIPRLDIKGPNLVKGIHLEGLRVLGRPEDFAKYYYEDGADELFFQDVVASLYERNSLHEIITKTVKEIFIPITVGGGIRTITDIRNVLRAGADKVCINTAAINNPDFIRQASRMFGSSTIVVAIETIRQTDGRYLAYTDNGREYTGIEATEWAERVEELGAGEIVLTSVDRDGTGDGFDLDLVTKITRAASIPIIVHGGARDSSDILSVIRDGNADAVAVASILHYNYIKHHNSEKACSEEGNVEFLLSRKSFSKIQNTTLHEIKEFLQLNDISLRL